LLLLIKELVVVSYCYDFTKILINTYIDLLLGRLDGRQVTETLKWKEVRPKEVRPKEVRPKVVRPKEVRPKVVRPKEVRPKVVRPKEVRPKEVRPKVVRPKRVRFSDFYLELATGKLPLMPFRAMDVAKKVHDANINKSVRIPGLAVATLTSLCTDLIWT
jgi:hypothetical protein